MFGKPNSLRQRAALYILAPVFVLLISIEVIGFNYIKSMLLQQMRQTGISQLQRTAHYIESQLRLPKKLMAELALADELEVRTFLSDTVQSLDGVIELRQTAPHPLSPITPANNSSPPEVFYDPLFEDKTVLLHTTTPGNKHQDGYSATLSISFYDLVGHIPKSPWWNGVQTFMLDTEGNILRSVDSDETITENSSSPTLQMSVKNKARLQQLIKERPIGSMSADDSQNTEIIYGYHKLKEAPYTMVVVNDSAIILKPLQTFRLAYLLSSLIVTAVILFLLNLMAGRIIRTTQELSTAADHLANGHFDKPLHSDRNDEVGHLVQSFNSMSKQLQQGIQVQKSLMLAGEIQQSLLPQSEFINQQFEAFGFSLPCDETGGDFFDILPCSGGKLFLMVGDVVGHGVGAALLMATTRALLRSEIEHASDLSSCANRINRLLCRDTAHSGNFSTLFLLSLENSNRTLHWVRAGHEPAMLYNLEQDVFTELRGNGMVLGIEAETEYEENSVELPEGEHLILIGSDGLTELENMNGERFDKNRIQHLIRQHVSSTAKEILAQLNREITTFAGDKRSDDDITAVIAKIR
ncbi:SpoIIE family protein phosphatase [Desulforhopalus sp. 52FAK]